MAKSETNNEVKGKKEVPSMVKTIVALVEVVARYLAAYLLFNHFDHIIVIVVAWYLLLSATGAFVVIFYKAFNK